MKKIEKYPDLVEVVKDSLFDGILTGDLQPGQKLRQKDLAERLGVSRQPVSHALRLLEEQGVLTALDSRSLTVAEPDLCSILHMMAIRKELDGLAAEASAQKFADNRQTDEDMTIVSNINKLLKRNLETRNRSAKRNVQDDIRFHELVRDLSGNPYIQESLARYVLHHNRFIYLMAKDMDQKIWLEHRVICDAIVAGDGNKAKTIMQAHIARGTQKLLDLSQAAD